MIRMRHGRSEAVVEARSASDPNADAVEHIPTGRFFLRTGLGRRAGGSYYTPHEFVRFLVRETLTPLVNTGARQCRSGSDPAHQGVRPRHGQRPFSGGSLSLSRRRAVRRLLPLRFPRHSWKRAGELIAYPIRISVLASYLPGRSLDNSDTGISRTRALAICRRLVTVHCLYGVDQDKLGRGTGETVAVAGVIC